jgi:hypothetical protein
MPRGSKDKKQVSARKKVKPSLPEGLYNTEMAADYLGCTPGHIRKLVELKKLQPEETGGRDLYFKKR